MRQAQEPVQVLFVCMGNICRSPTAEAVFKARVHAAGLAQCIASDSAGTHGYHIGEPPDVRAQRAGQRRGYDLSVLRARKVEREDFARFHYVLAMDEVNMSALRRVCPQDYSARVQLLTDYCTSGACEVPDPYYGDAADFERVLDLVEEAAEGLLQEIRNRHGL